MDQVRSMLVADWVSLVLLGVAAALAFGWQRRRQRNEPALALLLLASSLALFSVGGLLASLADTLRILNEPSLWLGGLAALAAAVLFGMFLVLLASSRWSAPAAFATAAVMFLGLGGFAGMWLTREVMDAIAVLVRVEIVQPAWLLLLLLIPLIVYFSYRSLAGLGPVRRWVALGLRCLLILLLTLALAEVRLRHPNENVTVLFLVDRSLSVPEEHDLTVDPKSPQARVDLRWERVKKFINEAVEKRGSSHDRDRAGVIVFGRRPRLELPPSAVPRFNMREITSQVDPTYTDIAAALKLALASFPEGTAKRVVLISDGNENLGNAEEQARIAKQNGVQIDVMPLAAGQRNDNEVLVQSVEAPTLTEQSSQLSIRVLLRSYNPNVVQGILKLWQISGARRVQVPGPRDDRVFLRPGLNPFTFKHRVDKKDESYTYEAVFEPERVLNDKGEVVQGGLQGDRVQNNRASTHVIALGKRRILLIEPKVGDHEFLVDHLRKVEGSRFTVHTITPDDLPQNRAELSVFLSNYDCVILANVPASDVQPGDVKEKPPATITEEQQEVLRTNTYDQGCGLIMIGGPYSFGAGGWQGTAVEKALPVDCDIKSLKVTGKGGLVLIMHACEMSDGNSWEKKIAQLALKKLAPTDEFGVIQWNFNGTGWVPNLKLQEIGENRDKMLGYVDRMTPSDMPEFDTGLKMAYGALTEEARNLATKHVIIISDGDPQQSDAQLLGRMKAAKVTVTTVGVATHGAPMDQNLARIAAGTGGRFYNVKSAKALPAIYTKESRLVSQAFIYKQAFRPQFQPVPDMSLADKLPRDYARLYGFVRTTPKQSNLYNGAILGPTMGDQEFPVLAYWQYGLGKSVAFTSDALKGWDRDWAAAPYYEKFWEGLVGWACRSVETGRLSMTTEYRDGKIKVVIDARDRDGKMLTDLTIRGRASAPDDRGESNPDLALRFEQINSGIYVAEFKADEAGSYFLSAQAKRIVKKKGPDGKEKMEEELDGIRTGVTVPYSPEFADLESNTVLLEKLRDITGGQTLSEEPEKLFEAANSGIVFRHSDLPQSRSLQPIWYWLLLATATFLLFDVAARRIAVDPLVVTAAVEKGWERLRGRNVLAAATPQFLDRLKSRKEQIGETLGKAAAKFDAGEAPPSMPPPASADEVAAAAPPPGPRPAARPQGVAPDKPEEAADFASRLMKAKKRVWEDRDKDKDK
ncbi:hypothetical protein AYO40_01480 [Planctomycetaceae bacterium SCGC AG-212-D15]|nr:hypothetical protein AYO40_01480 [Planctomycetaceae bacterium SCGC AG-212-D15]